MRTVEFSRYDYVPSILADQVGQIAYEKLLPETKAGILPIFELCWRPHARDFGHSETVVHSIGHYPFILDINKRVAPEPYVSRDPQDPARDKLRVQKEWNEKRAFDAELERLLRATDGFFEWRNFVRGFPNAIPTLQVTNPHNQRDEVLRQAQLLCMGGASAAFRITPKMSEETCVLAAEILRSVDSPGQVVVIFDCGQGRTNVPKRSAFVADALLSIRNAIGPKRAHLLRAVCMSNSFKLPHTKGTRFKENLDREIWRRISTGSRLAFGDYAGSERLPLSAYRPPGWLPTVTHALGGGWLISRHSNKNDPAGWISCCKAISADARFSPISSWGDQAIDETANTEISALDRQLLWHAARMNGHIERQFSWGGAAIRKAA